MKLKNRELINTLNGLLEISEVEMPISLAYRLNSINAKLTQQYRVYENTLKQTNNIESKVFDLLETEFEIDLETIAMAELLENNLTIKPKTLALLDKIIEE